jgi:hypothetical protein
MLRPSVSRRESLSQDRGDDPRAGSDLRVVVVREHDLHLVGLAALEPTGARPVRVRACRPVLAVDVHVVVAAVGLVDGVADLAFIRARVFFGLSGLNGAFDRVQLPGWPQADEVPIRIGQVVHIRSEAGPGDAPAGDAARPKLLDLSLEILRRELEADATARLAASVRIPCQDEIRSLLEDEEGAVGIRALVVGRLGACPEQARVEVDRIVEVGDVEMDRGDEAQR